MTDLEAVPPEDLPDSPNNGSAPTSGSPVPSEDLPENLSGQEVPNHDLPIDTEKYSTPGQQGLTAAEGIGQGLAGPISTGLEKGLNAIGVPGFTNQDIQGRRETNPTAFEVSKMAGNIGLMSILPEFKAGSAAINAAIQMFGISTGDEFSKFMLGNADPAKAVAAHIIGSTLFGAFAGKGADIASSSLRKLAEKKAEEKMGTEAMNWVAGAGHALTFPEGASTPESAEIAKNMYGKLQDIGADIPAFKAGQNAAKKIQSIGTNIIKGTVAGPLSTAGSVGGATAGLLLGPMAAKTGAIAGGGIGWGTGLSLGGALAKKIVPQMSEKIAGPVLLKMASNGNFQGIAKALDYGLTNYKGYRALEKGIESIFKTGVNESYGAVTNELLDKKRENLRNYIDIGGINNQVEQEQKNQFQNPPGFAKGGEVQMAAPSTSHPIANNWPDQHIGITAAKGRVCNYLNSIKPQKNKPKLPFDPEHKNPQEEREYDKALDIANHPMGVIDHIKKGTLTPKHMSSFNAMYPELHQEFSKKMMEHIMKNRLEDSKIPPYHVRQSLSLFMGQNLDSTLTQPNMMAAQNVFAQQNAMKNQPPNSKSSLSKLGESAMTPEQSRTARLNKN